MSDQEKYSRTLLEQTPTPFSREALNFLCDERLGSGMTREVFSYAPDPDEWVIKIEINAQWHWQNIREYETWKAIQDTKLAKWFAPCGSVSPCGTFLLQRRVQPIAAIKLPAEIPSFFTDLKMANWGVFKDHPVCHDYGKHLLLEKGMTSRMRRAEWL